MGCEFQALVDSSGPPNRVWQFLKLLVYRDLTPTGVKTQFEIVCKNF